MDDARHTATGPGAFAAPDLSKPIVADIAGSRVRFSGESPAIRARLAALLEPFLSPVGAAVSGQLRQPEEIAIHLEPAPAQGGWRVFINGDFLTMAYDSTYLLPYLEWLAISRAIERSTQSVAFHAASLAWERRAVILIAGSGSGKTTLTAGLAGRGWAPLADDLTVVDLASQSAHPFRRCFHADAFTRSVIGEAIHAITPDPALPDYIRPAVWARGACEPAWIVVIQRDPEAASSIRPITRAQAAGALFTSSIRGALSRSVVARLSAGLATSVTGCWEVNNSDLDGTLDLMESAMLRS